MEDQKKFAPQEEFSIEFGDVNGTKLYEILNKSQNDQKKKPKQSEELTKE